MILIIASNTKDLDKIYYSDGWKEMVLLNTNLQPAAYELNSEGFEDGDKNNVYEFQRLDKYKSFKIEANEFMVDWLMKLPMLDSLEIKDFESGESVTPTDVEVEVEIVDYTYLVTVKFICYTLIKRIADSNMS